MGLNRGAGKEEPPRKRVKKNIGGASAYKFSSTEDIRLGLRSTNQEGLVEALTALRNQLTVRPDESSIAPQDERLVLAQAWLETDPGAHDIFDIWDRTDQRQMSLLALVVSVVSCLVTLLSSHYTYHSTCRPILQSILSQKWSTRLNTYLAGTHSELILMTLKLYNGVSAFASGKERKSVLDAFAWETKTLPKLLFMRRKAKADDMTDSLSRPDIRTLYMIFVLSFVETTSSTLVKSSFIEQHRDILASLFKGLIQDPYPVVKKLLETCWAGIWSDPKIKRTLKIQLFNESTVGQIAKLYGRSTTESSDSEQIPADLVHHFLLAICTRPGMGLCFRDRGWYPRDSDTDALVPVDGDETGTKSGKIFNKMLANILKGLQVNEDPRQQELALKILTACPELVAGYWTAVNLTLEPRLSSKWLANVAFFGTAVSLPVPTACFFHPESGHHQPSPPPLTTVIENVLPTSGVKTNLTKGLQSTSPLVQHCTALALAKCLKKLDLVLQAFRSAEEALEENEEDGQWSRRRKEIEREARRRVPDLQVVLAFAQQASAITPTSLEQRARFALLAEVAQRLLWLYQACLPDLVTEARFDVGKALQHFTEGGEAQVDHDVDNMRRLHTLRRLHVLAFLRESDQFSLFGKQGPHSQTNLRVLLKEYATTSVKAVLSGASSLLRRQLSETILFQHDADEVELWLRSLPSTKRAPGAEAPDGAPLTDEGESVIALLDECAQRCLKTPYRYLEDAEKMAAEAARGSDNELDAVPPAETIVSPLLMTVLEQLSAKVASALLTPSDILALASFFRKLVFLLAMTGVDRRFLRAYVQTVDDALEGEGVCPNHPIMRAAIRREVDILIASFQQLENCSGSASLGEHNSAVDVFLARVEETIPDSLIGAPIVSAYELVDWLRLVESRLEPQQLQRVFYVVRQLHPPALKALIDYLCPAHNLLWAVISETQLVPLEFAWALIQTSDEELADTTIRKTLTKIALTPEQANLADIKRTCRSILMRSSPAANSDDLQTNLLYVLAEVLGNAREVLSTESFVSLKTYVFAGDPTFRALCTSPSQSPRIAPAFHGLIRAVLRHSDEDDRKIALGYFSYLMSADNTDALAPSVDLFSLLAIWSEYAGPEHQFDLLERIVQSSHLMDASNIVGQVLNTLLHSTTRNLLALQKLGERASLLCSISRSYKQYPEVVASVEELTALAVKASLPSGYSGKMIPSGLSEVRSMSALCEDAETRWRQRSTLWSAELDVDITSMRPTSNSQLRINIEMAYRTASVRTTLVSWVMAHAQSAEPTQLADAVYALCDAALLHKASVNLGSDAGTVFKQLVNIASDHRTASGVRVACCDAAQRLLVVMSEQSSSFAKQVEDVVAKLPVDRLTPETLVISRRLKITDSPECLRVMDAIIDHALGWVVRYYAENHQETEDSLQSVYELTRLLHQTSKLKPHLVEPVLAAVVQHRFTNKPALGLVMALLHPTNLKPVVVNRHLQSILQYPLFSRVCSPALLDEKSPRDELVSVLFAMFNLHPTNTCQASHIEPLASIYGGTLSLSDRKIFAIFRLFEQQRNTSVASLLEQWSSTPETPSSNALEAMRSLEPARVLRTCLLFPMWRRSYEMTPEPHDPSADQLYDPLFIMLLFARAMDDGSAAVGMAWVEVFRTNVVSLLIRTLSSKCDSLRELALCQLAMLRQVLESADMQEQPLVLYILKLVQNLIPDAADDLPPRLPSYNTLFLAHALRAIFYPANFIYPLTARFLLQRPEIDMNDVPMLYGMLYSNSDDWKKERSWIVRFLADGMCSSEDWRVLRRRHTWDLLASLFQSSTNDRPLRQGVLEFLLSLTCNKQAATSLVLKSALLSWVEAQLRTPRADESAAWIRIIENITVVVDPGKMEAATNSEWKNILGRCVGLLLQGTAPAEILALACPVILRLSYLPGAPSSHLPRILSMATQSLRSFESKLDVSSAACNAIALEHHSTILDTIISMAPPHSAQTLHLSPASVTLRTWGACVEALWRMAMRLETKCAEWDVLTARLLLWRSLVGEECSEVGEWARREVVKNLEVLT